MDKSLWIINDYAGAPCYGMTYRHYYIARELVKQRCCVTILSASFSHFFKQFPPTKGKYTSEQIDGIFYLWIKVVTYAKAFSLKRVLKWFDFTLALLFLPYQRMSRPDAILVSPTAPFAIVPAWYWARRFRAKLVFEVRDIWPLTLVELGKYSPRHPFIVFMGWFERFALTKSDCIISNLPNYGQHIKELGIQRAFTYIPNGVSIEEMASVEPLEPEVTVLIPMNKFIIGYAGKFGVSNAIDDLVAAAKKLADRPDIYFVLVGDGQEREACRKNCREISNVIFINTIHKRQIQSLLHLFDICYIGLKREKLFEYGVSPNKLFDYMYAAKPILHAITTTKDIVTESGCGISVEAENPDAIVDGIVKLYEMTPEQRQEMGKRGRKYVEQNHDYRQLAEKMLELIKV